MLGDLIGMAIFLRNLLASLLLAVVFAFVFVFSQLILSGFIYPNSYLISQASAAFMGAFFAFLFVRLGDFVTRLYDREKNHYNSLVGLEKQFNEHLATISDDLYLIPQFCEPIRAPKVVAFGLHPILIDKSSYQQLHNLEVLNKLFHFNDGARKFNNDLEMLRELYVAVRNHYMEGKISVDYYNSNTAFIAEQFKSLELFLRELQREALQILALSTIRTRRDIPLGTQLQRLFLIGIHSKVKERQLEKEMKKIENEQGPRKPMAEPNGSKQQSDVQIQLYRAYLGDLGRIGGRQERSRKFYISVMSALFVFLSMAGENCIFVNVQGAVLVIVGVVGILICVAWFEHMRSFGILYGAKLGTLRSMEEDLPLKPFTVETEALKKHDQKDSGNADIKWRYTPLTVVDRITPAASILLFIGLLVFKFLK